MKKNLQLTKLACLFLICILFSLQTLADNINSEISKKVAINAFSENSGFSKSQISISESFPVIDEGETVYTVYNFNPKGFIIISGDDLVEPILGYGFDDIFKFDGLPSNLSFLLNQYKKEITAIKKVKIKKDETIFKKWERLSSDNPSVSLKSYNPGTPLIQTTWGQGNSLGTGYNRYCPFAPGTSQRCKVGCGGVAIAQILRYWGCRVFPDDEINYLPAGFQDTVNIECYYETYNWSSMGNTSSDDYNAKLLYHAAAAAGSNFALDSTDSQIYGARIAFIYYFGMNNQLNVFEKSNYNNSVWIDMLKNEIDNYRPLYYAGTDDSNNTSHAWVIDGYRNNTEFHCNWGWDGQYNGWFQLSNLNPYGHFFDSDFLAILGIYPIIENCTSLSLGYYNVCPTGNSTFSITIPASANVVWSKSNSLTQVGGNTGTSYTVCYGNDGEGTVTATVKNSHNVTYHAYSQNVLVGEPQYSIRAQRTDAVPINTGPYGDYLACSNTEFVFTLIPQPEFLGCHGSSIIWEVPESWTIVNNYGHYIVVNNNDDPANTISVSFATCCDDDGYEQFSFDADYCSSFNLEFSPNPVTEQTTMTIVSNSKEIDFNTEWEYEIYDNKQVIKEKKTKQRSDQITINTSAWHDGIYYVRVRMDKELISGKLIVKKY